MKWNVQILFLTTVLIIFVSAFMAANSLSGIAEEKDLENYVITLERNDFSLLQDNINEVFQITFNLELMDFSFVLVSGAIDVVRPTVRIDGDVQNGLANDEQKSFHVTLDQLRGRSLEIYYYLKLNTGEHGVREIQRALGYPSPTSASYHLDKLVRAEIISKTLNNKYLIDSDVKLGKLRNQINLLGSWVSEDAVLTKLMVVATIISLVYYFSRVSAFVWLVTFLPLFLGLSVYFNRKVDC